MLGVIGTVAAGVVARTLIPFLQEIRDNPGTTFEWRFLIPPVTAILIALLGLPLLLANVPPELLNAEQLTLSNAVALFIIGWGGTDLAREGQKFFIRDK